MPTTAEYLSDLVSQKSELAQVLSEAGAEAEASETFDTLIPKVSEATVNVKSYADNTFSNAFKGTAYGEIVTVDDASPVSHSLKITAESCNLLPFPYEVPGDDCTAVLSDGGIVFTTHEQSSGTLKVFTLRPGTYTAGAILNLTGGSLGGYIKLTVSRTNGSIGNALAVLTVNSSENKAAAFTLTEETEVKVTYSVLSTPLADEDGNTVEWTAEFYPAIFRGTVAAEDIVFKPYAGTGEGVSVSLYGKNLFNFDRTEGALTSGYANTNTRTDFDFDTFYIGMTRNNWYIPDNITAFSYEGDSFTFSVKTAFYGVGFPVKVLPNTNYIASGVLTNCSLYCGFFTKDGEYISESTKLGISGVTTPENCEILLLCVCAPTDNTECSATDIQLELGTAKTDYELYTEPQTAVADESGEVNGLKSISPCMSLFTDTENTAIDLEYNRDINRAFSELCEPLATLPAT